MELSLPSALPDHEHESQIDAGHQHDGDAHLGEHQTYPRSSAPPKRNVRRAIDRAWPCCDTQSKKALVILIS
jgi:hypothetical protein